MKAIDWVLGHVLTASIGFIGGFVLGLVGYAYARGTRTDEENESLIKLENSFRDLKNEKSNDIPENVDSETIVNAVNKIKAAENVIKMAEVKNNEE